MKAYLLMILAVLLCINNSCDNRKDPFYLKDTCPQVFIKRANDTLFEKVINDSNKIGVTYQVAIKYQIDENVPLKMRKNVASDSIYISGSKFYVNNTKQGNCVYSLSLKDSYGKADSAILNIVSFKNLPPVSSFEILKNYKVDSLAVSINAAGSFDQDKKWGGYIIEYEYNLNGLVYRNSIDSINYIFGSNGQKRIGVRVMDNDSTWSEIVTKYITL